MLKLLFENKHEDHFINIWTLPDKVSFWSTSIDECAAYITKQEGKDVYFGLGLSAKNHGQNRRCKANDVIAIPGLWADFDIKEKAFVSIDEILYFLEKYQIAEPSLIVSSGNGYHFYWLFKEPMSFDNQKERDAGIAFSAKWARFLVDTARHFGRDVDSVGDLSRVLRVPGTLNHKNGKPVPVEIFKQSDLRYIPDDFQKYISDIKLNVEQGVPVDGLNLNPAAVPPFKKFEALKVNSEIFLKTWECRRKDLSDSSQSGLDMSIANQCAQAGFSDQEIADTLIAFRTKNGAPLKLREDYYKRTIFRAKAGIEEAQSLQMMEELAVDMGVPVDDEQRQQMCEHISRIFNVELSKIIKYISKGIDDPVYVLETGKGNITIGDVAVLLSQTQCRNKIAAATGVCIPMFKPEKWHPIRQVLLNACIEIDLGEVSRESSFRVLLEKYLKDSPPAAKTAENLEAKYPIKHNGQIYIAAGELRNYAMRVCGEKIGLREIGINLKRLGAQGCAVSYKDNKEHPKSVGMWRLSG